MGGVVMGGGKHRVLFEAPYIDPAKFGLFYHAALLFRRGDVRIARRTIGIQIPEDMIFKPLKSMAYGHPESGVVALTTISEKHRVGMMLPGQTPTVDKVISPTDTTLVVECDGDVSSDTGQLYRNWRKGYGWIDTPYTKVAYGFLVEVGGDSP